MQHDISRWILHIFSKKNKKLAKRCEHCVDTLFWAVCWEPHAYKHIHTLHTLMSRHVCISNNQSQKFYIISYQLFCLSIVRLRLFLCARGCCFLQTYIYLLLNLKWEKNQIASWHTHCSIRLFIAFNFNWSEYISLSSSNNDDRISIMDQNGQIWH